jgi:hypothetical protein
MDMAAAEQMRPNEESGASRVLARRQEAAVTCRCCLAGADEVVE